MIKKTIPDDIKSNILNDYELGLSIRSISKKYLYSTTLINKILKKCHSFEDDFIKNDDCNIIAICKKTGKNNIFCR